MLTNTILLYSVTISESTGNCLQWCHVLFFTFEVPNPHLYVHSPGEAFKHLNVVRYKKRIIHLVTGTLRPAQVHSHTHTHAHLHDAQVRIHGNSQVHTSGVKDVQFDAHLVASIVTDMRTRTRQGAYQSLQ